jgi:hypothetical protein
MNGMNSRSLMKGVCVLAFGLVLAGCAANNYLAQKPKPKAPAQKAPADQPLVVDSTRVVVIPNPYVDDLTLANKAADEAKQELTKRGVKMVGTEAEADVVAVPTVETDVTVVNATTEKQPDVFMENAGLQMDRAWAFNNSVGSLGSKNFQPSVGKSGDQLVIEGFQKDAWDRALIVNELQLQPVWKVRVTLPKALKPSLEGAAVARTVSDTNFELPH